MIWAAYGSCCCNLVAHSSAADRTAGHRRALRRHFLGAALDDFVEFAAVQPDSAALRAIIDFDALPLTHGEGNVANRARHGFVGMGHDQFSVLRSKMCRRRTVGIGSAGRTAT